MKEIRPNGMTKTARRAFASWLGRRSYAARVERLGIARVQEISRQNGRKGGRPRKSNAEKEA